jgi:hypothetical protein
MAQRKRDGCVLEKQDKSLWIGIIELRIEPSDGLEGFY